MKIVDLRDCSASGLFLRWARRKGVEYILVDGVPWIAKHSRTTRDPGQKSSAVHVEPCIRASRRANLRRSAFPSGETMLGYRKRQARSSARARTSRFPESALIEFKDIKNALSDDDGGFDSAPSDGESVFLGDVLATIETFDLLRSVPGVLERFWDIACGGRVHQEPGRSNGNWGVLMDASFSYELAGVRSGKACCSALRRFACTAEDARRVGI